MSDDEMDRRIEELSREIKKSPSQPELYYERGGAFFAQENLARAEADLTRALDLDAGHAEAWDLRGGIRQARSDLRRAIADFDRAVALDPDATEYREHRGHAHLANGDAEGAIADFSKWIELDSEDSQAWLARSEARRLAGDLKGADSDRKQALALDPSAEAEAPTPERLAARDFQESELRDAVVAALREELLRVIASGPMTLHVWGEDGTEAAIDLSNAWREAKASSAKERASIIERETAMALAAIEAAEADESLDSSTIVPAVRPRSVVEAAEEMTQGADPGDRLVHRPLAGDVVVVYGFDREDVLQLMTERHRAELGLSREQVHELAMENFSERYGGEVERTGDAQCCLLSVGGDYEANLLLVEEIWEDMESVVEGDIVACVPARGVLLFTGTAVPGGVEKVRKAAAEAFRKEGHPISTTLLRRAGKRWVAFKEDGV